MLKMHGFVSLCIFVSCYNVRDGYFLPRGTTVEAPPCGGLER